MKNRLDIPLFVLIVDKIVGRIKIFQPHMIVSTGGLEFSSPGKFSRTAWWL